MLLPSLPQELLAYIFGFLENRQDLCRLCLTCSSLYISAAQRLYSSLNLISARFKSSIIIRALQVVARKPFLAKSVRFLAIVLMADRRPPHPLMLISAYSRLVFRTMRLMSGLKDLQYVTLSNPDYLDLQSNLGSCSFELTDLQVPTLCPLDIGLLKRQSSVKTLGVWELVPISEEEGAGWIVDELLPCLTRLRTRPQVARELVPGRPVKHLILDEQPRLSPSDIIIPEMSNSIGPLQSLHLHLPDLRSDLLFVCARYLPSLVELSVTLRWTTAAQAIAALDTPTTMEAFCNLPCFSKLCLSSVEAGHLTESDYSRVLSRWGDVCPSLRELRIDRQSNPSNHLVVSYTRVINPQRADAPIGNVWERNPRFPVTDLITVDESSEES